MGVGVTAIQAHLPLPAETWGHLRFMNCWDLLWTRVVNSLLVCWASLSRELTSRILPLGGEAREAILRGEPLSHPHPQLEHSRMPSSSRACAPPLWTGSLRLHQGRGHRKEMAELGQGRAGTDTQVCALCTHSVASDSRPQAGPPTKVDTTQPLILLSPPDGGPGEAQHGSAGSAWPRPRNEVSRVCPPRATLVGGGLGRMYDPQASLPFMATRAPSLPASAPGTSRGRSQTSSQPPPSSPPFTPSDSEFRADKQKQAQSAPESRLRATSCIQLLPRHQQAPPGRSPGPCQHCRREVKL